MLTPKCMLAPCLKCRSPEHGGAYRRSITAIRLVAVAIDAFLGHVNTLTPAAVLTYARAHQGNYRTLKQGRPFSLRVEDNQIIFRPSSGNRFEPEIEEYVRRFNQNPSFKPGDYPQKLWSRSYFVTLVAKMLGQKSAFNGGADSQETSELPSEEFERKVRALRKRGTAIVPMGQATPERVGTRIVEFKRDPAVKAWVLEFADGKCELCRKPAPFWDDDANPFLELHHVEPLAAGGPDTIANAAAVCPNCHRACHHSHRRVKLTATLYRQCPRLLQPVR